MVYEAYVASFQTHNFFMEDNMSLNVIFYTFLCQNEIARLNEEKTSFKQQLESSNSTVAILKNEKSKLQQEIAESKKEQDDFLVLLADQDQKIVGLKNKLKELGEPVRYKICKSKCET